MPEFRSWRSYRDFELSVKLQNRYVRPPEVEEFLTTVVVTSKARRKLIPQKQYLWRAQLGHDWCPIGGPEDDQGELESPLPAERMKPPHDNPYEGRANPKGIAYLYCATDAETAMAEVRPWVGSYVSVAQFEPLRDLSVVDCCADQLDTGLHPLLEEEPEPEEREKAVWSDINIAFSKPVSLTDQVVDYVPTQVIAELFKAEGADGILYRSALGKGLNVALFDLDAANQVNGFLFRVKGLKFEFEEDGIPIFLPGRHDASAAH